MDIIRQKKTAELPMTAKKAARLAAGGFAAGVVSGIFGNGGGVLVVFLFGSMAGRLFGDSGLKVYKYSGSAN
jgi:uncharacterized membrane protein YfcA